MYFIRVLITLSDKGREMQHNDFSFFSKKKKRRERKKKKKKGMNLEYPKQNFVSKARNVRLLSSNVSKPNLKQEKACLLHLTRWKNQFTLFKWQQGHWSANALSCIKQIGCSVLILLFTYFLKRKAGLLSDLLCAHVSGMANTSVRSWFNVSLQV